MGNYNENEDGGKCPQGMIGSKMVRVDMRFFTEGSE